MTKVTYQLKEPCSWSMFRSDCEPHSYVDVKTTYASGKFMVQTLELPHEQAKELAERMKEQDNEQQAKSEEPPDGRNPEAGSPTQAG